MAQTYEESEGRKGWLRRPVDVILAVMVVIALLVAGLLLFGGSDSGDKQAGSVPSAQAQHSITPLGEPTGAAATMDVPVTAPPISEVENTVWDPVVGHPVAAGADSAPLEQSPGDDAPVNVRIPAVGLNIGVVSEGVTESGADQVQMNLPFSDVAGWLASSSSLAVEADGATVIAGHVNYTSGALAPMSRIAQATQGQKVLTTDTEGDVQQWTITESTAVSQQELSERFALESGTGERKLLLVTCELGPTGAFDHNRVVIATPA